ncbi:hypothetical protein SNE40_017485 [Patella caerulea]|uniref:Uncharacterized protein n=1 Tax=Patella caerulea TaxID=87958 RepID=A0AAN8JB83_PATCE
MEVVLEERRVMEQYFDDSRKCTAGRRSEDKILNRYGERLNELCSNVGQYFLNGRCGQDINLGKFTCNETSVVDYFICSPKVLPCIEDFYVNDSNSLLSDKHNAVCYEIRKRKNKQQLTRAVEETVTNVTKVRWKDDLQHEFCANIDENKLCDIEKSIENLNIGEAHQTCINHMLRRLKMCFVIVLLNHK